MFTLLEKFSKNRAIKSYIKKLRPLLVRRYGKSKYYTQGQIDKTLQEHKFNQRYCLYAYALYLSKESFAQLNGEGSLDQYVGLRDELGHSYFGGNVDFDAASSTDVSYGSSADGGGFSD